MSYNIVVFTWQKYGNWKLVRCRRRNGYTEISHRYFAETRTLLLLLLLHYEEYSHIMVYGCSTSRSISHGVWKTVDTKILRRNNWKYICLFQYWKLPGLRCVLRIAIQLPQIPYTILCWLTWNISNRQYLQRNVAKQLFYASQFINLMDNCESTVVVFEMSFSVYGSSSS